MRENKVDQILEQRLEQYGDAKTEFTAIGRIWGALLKIDDIEPYEVALMMDALKTVRCFANPRLEDSWDDKFGYTRHGVEIVKTYGSQ